MTDTYDYIIVGAGSAGAALAYRLTEDPNTRVLLLEAGKSVHPLSRLPVSFGLFIDKPGVNWRYFSDPEPGTTNRKIPVPRGKMLGGSSSINGLVYVRGQTLDYDTWAQMAIAAGAGRTSRRSSSAWKTIPTAAAIPAAAAARLASQRCRTRTRSTTP
ncbi:MAG: GMC family oxidoreductase N-terminal domain-containing protein [Alphaproteobacteria bacterium]|nr:GMC family oxidoreductase N-terminal domain-containing protein [Alphaproteobacteria bacterium]